MKPINQPVVNKMAHIDTLSYYEALIKAGSSELEAKAHVYAMSTSIEDLVNKSDLHEEFISFADKLDIKFATINAELKYMRQLGYAMFAIVILPFIKTFILG